MPSYVLLPPSFLPFRLDVARYAFDKTEEKTVCHKYIIRLSSNDRFGLKDFTLPAGMTCGLAGFLAFHYVRWLAPVKPAAQAAAEALMPTVLFIMLFATFCKVNPRDMRVRGWHVWLVTFRLLSCLLIALYLHFTPGAPGELLLEGTHAVPGVPHGGCCRRDNGASRWQARPTE